MSDADLTRDEVRLALAERLSAPCPGCNRVGCPKWTPDYPQGSADCGGTGLLWPLREPCWEQDLRPRWAHVYSESPPLRCIRGMPVVLKCLSCRGRGWVPKEMHLEDLLKAAAKALHLEKVEVIYYKGITVRLLVQTRRNPIREIWFEGKAAEILEAAERALLEALPTRRERNR